MNLLEQYDLLTLLPISLMLVATIRGVLTYSTLNESQKLIHLLVTLSFFISVLARQLANLQLNTFPLYHSFAIVEFSLLFLFYEKSFQLHWNKTKKSYIILSFFFIGVLNVCFLQNIFSPNTNIILPSFLIWTVVSIIYLIRILAKKQRLSILKDPAFWVSSGLLIYCSSSFLLFTFSESILQIPITETFPIWLLNILFNIIHYIAFNLALWIRPIEKPLHSMS